MLTLFSVLEERALIRSSKRASAIILDSFRHLVARINFPTLDLQNVSSGFGFSIHVIRNRSITRRLFTINDYSLANQLIPRQRSPSAWVSPG